MDLKLQYDKLLRYCYHKTKSKDLAEDIVQETFLKFWQSHSYEDTGKERAYIARNLCTDIYRRQESNQEYPEDLPCPDYDPEQTLNRIAVDTALEQMPEQLREMVVMRYVSELSAAGIGKIMNLSRFAVSRRLKELLYKQIVYVFSTEKGDTKMNNTLLGKTLKAMYKQSGKTITQLSDETDLSMVADFSCEKKDMLLVNYEALNGGKRHNRLWNGGNGKGTILLYEHGKLIDEIAAENTGCEYGEFDTALNS